MGPFFCGERIRFAIPRAVVSLLPTQRVSAVRSPLLTAFEVVETQVNQNLGQELESRAPTQHILRIRRVRALTIGKDVRTWIRIRCRSSECLTALTCGNA